MADRPAADVEYHLLRARREREVAYRSVDDAAADAHMRLSALHLQRAMLLQEVQRRPVGNVHPLRRREEGTPPSRALKIL